MQREAGGRGAEGIIERERGSEIKINTNRKGRAVRGVCGAGWVSLLKSK